MKIVPQQNKFRDNPEQYRRVAILGFGREGQAVLKFLKKSLPAGRQGRECKKAEIWILDKNPKIKLPDTINRIAIKRQLGKNYLKNLERFDVIFRSPGVPYNLPEIQKALKKDVKFSSATKLFFEEVGKMVRRDSPQVIGITGTKGKGTTATLLYKILKASGKKVYIAGNMGIPPFEILRKADKNSIAILELSSFQLQDLKKSPQIAVILDIFPDHLDAHKNFSEYLNAKANIACWQKKTDKIFYFSDNKWAKWIASKSRAKKIPLKFVRLPAGRQEWWNSLREIIKIPGEHNLRNAVMAATVALSLSCPKEKIIKIIKGFRGNEHRLELTRKIMVRQAHHKNKSQIYFYNDSASTNPQTAAAAIYAFNEPKILIAGGKDKGLNYSPLAQALKNSHAKSAPPHSLRSHFGNPKAPIRIKDEGVKLVILFGENKNKIKKAISKSGVLIKIAGNLEEAVKMAYNYSRFQILDSKFSSIIFSPASASFDMFRNYAERGKKFKELVRKLK